MYVVTDGFFTRIEKNKFNKQVKVNNAAGNEWNPEFIHFSKWVRLKATYPYAEPSQVT